MLSHITAQSDPALVKKIRPITDLVNPDELLIEIAKVLGLKFCVGGMTLEALKIAERLIRINKREKFHSWK